MTRSLLAALAIALLLGCHHSSKPPVPPASPPTYTAPVWIVDELRVDDDLVRPTKMQLARQAACVERAWSRHYRDTTGGTYLPPHWPHGEQQLQVWVRRTCSNSADGPWKGRGRWGMWLKGWGCKAGEPRSLAFILSAMCVRLSHVLTGMGNGQHTLFHRVACGPCLDPAVTKRGGAIMYTRLLPQTSGGSRRDASNPPAGRGGRPSLTGGDTREGNHGR